MNQIAELWADPRVEIVLRSTVTSPFGRKVRIAAKLLGLEDRIRRIDADTRDPKDDLRQQNPLGKMPVLMIDGRAYYDSATILEMMDAAAGGGRLLPEGTGITARYQVLTRAKLADGITDAALLMVYERRFRETAQVSKIWLDHLRGKVERGLSAFETDPPDASAADIVSIGLACALGYLDWRQPVTWRHAHPKLVAWLDLFAAATPAYSETEGRPV